MDRSVLAMARRGRPSQRGVRLTQKRQDPSSDAVASTTAGIEPTQRDWRLPLTKEQDQVDWEQACAESAGPDLGAYIRTMPVSPPWEGGVGLGVSPTAPSTGRSSRSAGNTRAAAETTCSRTEGSSAWVWP